MRKNWKWLFTIGLFVIMLVGMTGCSKKNNIVGTWIRIDDEEGKYPIKFYDDGSCLDLPIETITSADAVSYKLQDDGELIFEMEWDGPLVAHPAETAEEALEDGDYYYLNGDQLILERKEYKKREIGTDMFFSNQVLWEKIMPTIS